MVTSAPAAELHAAESHADQIWFTGEPADLHSQQYLFELAAESGLGEVFVATDRPLSRGSVVDLSFPDAQDAKGIVAWSRSWFGRRGMLVKLFEVEGPRRTRGQRRRQAAQNPSQS
jgi:hypothetical protein